MILHALRLQSFRAHTDTTVSFGAGVNLVLGPNGAGKTNLLEAIHYLCLTKSFLASQDAYVLQQGQPFFEVEGQFERTMGSDARVRLAYVPQEGKKVFVNGAPLDRLADIVGRFPVVVFSPEDQALTAAGPDERRRFLNNILSQARPVYLDDLLKYRRALKQRNELLGQYRRRRGPLPPGLLDSWDAEVVQLGSRIVYARHRFLEEFRRFLAEAYGYMEAVAEEPSITYQGVIPLESGMDLATIEERYRAKLERMHDRERERGRTLLGPHRDELVFRIGDLEVRRYASQGQHRTFGMALKLAQHFYLHDRLEEKPILLLDDVFDNLDPRRSRVFLDLLQSDRMGQSLITAPRKTPFHEGFDESDPANRVLYVEAGDIVDTASV